MIKLDTSSIDDMSDDIYSVKRGSRVTVFLNGNDLKRCVYCNITKGVAICIKSDMAGKVIIAEDEIVHELIFGDITVKPIEDKTNIKRRLKL